MISVVIMTTMLKVFFLDVTVLDDDGLFDSYYAQISAYRKEKIDRFYRKSDKNLSLGAGILTDLFLKELGLREKDMVYRENQYGKPYFENLKDIFFNISHSGKWVMAAFSDGEVGCDIEEKKMPEEDISKFVLSKDEQKSDLISVWTKKESYLKFKGCGLATEMNSFSIEKIKYVKEIDIIEGYCSAVCLSRAEEPCCQIVRLA